MRLPRKVVGGVKEGMLEGVGDVRERCHSSMNSTGARMRLMRLVDCISSRAVAKRKDREVDGR